MSNEAIEMTARHCLSNIRLKIKSSNYGDDPANKLFQTYCEDHWPGYNAKEVALKLITNDIEKIQEVIAREQQQDTANWISHGQLSLDLEDGYTEIKSPEFVNIGGKRVHSRDATAVELLENLETILLNINVELEQFRKAVIRKEEQRDFVKQQMGNVSALITDLKAKGYDPEKTPMSKAVALNIK